ncbi:hypothetical protein CC1G_10679 [Coprinopsis cinerea okayama7|uniref:Uncharacterized protein n=1 Tax=Coprinopsis cinerea (strain Okayama-7 / 130 / ATCC MYA-4618 / FGSC 9003) TaxID=240176 RepID=A8NDQ5_COPC7|nr:hypothetical protein CC1G_10679 [Coprinopsis cinerea okayama7\|eukprot:XP_001832830.2 hypothetical protein CC1G_10679 [Coprinopsis cinerea okayama7\
MITAIASQNGRPASVVQNQDPAGDSESQERDMIDQDQQAHAILKAHINVM